MTFMTRMRGQNLPPEPPIENPHEIARESWDKLRNYAASVAIVAEEIDDENRTLKAENTSLQREVDRLTALNSQLARENRQNIAFAQAMRTRLIVIKEAIEVADREAVERAREEIQENAHEVAIPPTNSWSNGINMGHQE